MASGILVENQITSWKNHYDGTSEGTTGHYGIGFAFRLTDGRCVSYYASGILNSGMPMQMPILYDELTDRFVPEE